MSKIQIMLALASGTVLMGCSNPASPVATSAPGVPNCQTRASEHIGGAFSLIDHTGHPRTEADFKGTPSLVFFGFTYCPDVCPSTLVAINRALQQLPDSIEPPRTVLISVDPERDTPDALARYIDTPAFPENLTALTGSPDAVAAAAKAFYVGYDRVDMPDSLAEYTISHTSLIYLMDSDWRMSSFFLADENDPAALAACLGEHLRPDAE